VKESRMYYRNDSVLDLPGDHQASEEEGKSVLEMINDFTPSSLTPL